MFEIALPAGYTLEKLPEPFDRRSPYAHYHSEVTLDGNNLKYNRVLEINQKLVPWDAVSELREFYQLIDRDERSVVDLKRQSAASARTGGLEMPQNCAASARNSAQRCWTASRFSSSIDVSIEAAIF